jgi:hypothetical protein
MAGQRNSSADAATTSCSLLSALCNSQSSCQSVGMLIRLHQPLQNRLPFVPDRQVRVQAAEGTMSVLHCSGQKHTPATSWSAANDHRISAPN